jgi:ribosomal-protein-alanine N-acetyltransferase
VSAVRLWRGNAHDAGALARLHAPVFSDAWPQEAFASLLARDGVIVVLGARQGREDPEGFILLRVVAGEGEILTFCVAGEARGAGLGRALLEAGCEGARNLGACVLFLEVGEKNEAALALYRGAGFAVVGRRAAYYHHIDAPADALVMRKALGDG